MIRALRRALIGHSGFVGSTLKKQTEFSHLYRSTDIQDIRGQEFDLVVCAGISAKKWLANKNPETDLQAIESLMGHLKEVNTKQFVLISTVDVFKNPVEVDESSPVDTEGLHAYGRHRFQFEQFVQEQFKNSLIVRLPGLVGPGLQKNIIFDFLNNNNIEQIDSRHMFQFYPMVNLWADLQVALSNNIPLVHLTSAPMTVQELIKQTLFKDFSQVVADKPLKYDFRTQYGKLYGVMAPYQYSANEVYLAVRAYFQSEMSRGVQS